MYRIIEKPGLRIVSRSLPRNTPERTHLSPNWRPGDPSLELLTEEEAIRYLRLHEIEIKNPDETLQRYRKEGHLRGTQVSKKVFYLKSELDVFLKRMTDINPR